MNWQEKIISRIGTAKDCPKLVKDNTGILLSPAFTDFLTNHSIPYTVANDQQELLNASTDIVITHLTTIPSFIERKRDYIDFTFTLLPVDGDAHALKTLCLVHVLEILNYSDTHSLQYITAANVDEIVNTAIQANSAYRATQISGQLSDLSQHELDYTNVLKMGFLWGERLYKSFIGQCMPDIEVSAILDNVILPFWQSEHFRNTHYVSVSDFRNVDKICPYLKSLNCEKLALICFDGMGVSEWLLIQEYLRKNTGLYFTAKPIFSLLPSITLFSRKAVFGASYQDIYSKNLPDDFTLFSSFFNDRQVSFFREKDTLNENSLLGIDTVGLLYNFVDEIGHNTVLPSGTNTKGIYFKAIQEYVSNSNVATNISHLHSSGFKIFISSDHGNALCIGNGYKIEKYLIDKYSSRATVGPESILLELPELEKVEIPFISGKFAFLARNRECFSQKGQVAISHGGLSLEEMVVPFVEVLN